MDTNTTTLLVAIISGIGGIIGTMITSGKFPVFNSKNAMTLSIGSDEIDVIKSCPLFNKIMQFIQMDINSIHTEFLQDNRKNFELANKDFRVQNVIALCISIQLTVFHDNLQDQINKLVEHKGSKINKQKIVDRILENLITSNSNVIEEFKNTGIPIEIYNEYLSWYNDFFLRFNDDLRIALQKSDSFKILINRFFDLSGLFLSLLLSNYKYHLSKFNGDMYKNLPDNYSNIINFQKFNITKK